MLKHLRLLLLACACLLAPHAGAAELREIDWLDMIPPDELAELEKMADIEIDHNSDIPAEPIGSSRTVATMDGVRGKLPGYIVPLSSDDKNRVTEFFLVPYYGACIHVPPPPGNQIVWVKPAEPVPNVEIWNPYWIEGTMHVRATQNDVAAASYSFEAEQVRPYM
ncbi:DUF3299 domain-containing protein [Verticiella sediminum]|uniref:DUF3299 domain-containing protein n=1 Tax=Verticiella sediminum TaxID=1247510 RepID=A0A556AC93_9BURK|nr:DUF3299 domain-containing protein [Verticiella sediminum]TSH90512.1 DUF3299 domain-containing protein [Verticiella sediminum]